MSDVDATPQFDRTEATLPAAARRSRQVSVWASIRQQRLAMTGLLLVGLFLLVALIGPYVAPYGPTEQAIMDALQPPSSKHWLGTDDFGRDIFSRLLYGARISLEVGIVAVGIAGSVGILLGLLAGYAGGWIDNILTLLMDIVFAFPAILLAIAIISPSATRFNCRRPVMGTLAHASSMRRATMSAPLHVMVFIGYRRTGRVVIGWCSGVRVDRRSRV